MTQLHVTKQLPIMYLLIISVQQGAKHMQVQRMREDLAQTSAEKQEQESTIIEQQDHIEKLQDSCRELQEAAQALKEDGEQKYAASLAQSKQDRKEQVSAFTAQACHALCPPALTITHHHPPSTTTQHSPALQLLQSGGVQLKCIPRIAQGVNRAGNGRERRLDVPKLLDLQRRLVLHELMWLCENEMMYACV